jgi:hypothetical protein
MDARIDLQMLPQPNDTTCGPTCLQAVYSHFGDVLPVERVIAEVPMLETGGTLAVLLGTHALHRGYDALLYTYNLQVFDPTWFELPLPKIREKLDRYLEAKRDERVNKATRAYREFLDQGGRVLLQDLTTRLVRVPLTRGVPILAGLSATYLYRSAREIGSPSRFDDLHGEPQGHFVVLCGYSSTRRTVLVADPLLPNPMAPGQLYEVGIDRLVCAIMLGVLTFDANLLIVKPRRPEKTHGDPVRRQQP